MPTGSVRFACLDLAVTEYLEIYLNVAREDRQTVRRVFDPVAPLLIDYARGIAANAVQSQSPQLLRFGFLAWLLAGEQDDYRYRIQVAALLEDASVRVGVKPQEILAELAEFVDPADSESLHEFLALGPRDLRSFGFTVMRNGREFEYVPTQPNSGERT